MTIHTVLGPIEAGDLGATTMHEHLFLDVAAQYSPPVEPLLGEQVVKMENLGYLRWNVNGCRDNLVIDDAEMIADELSDMLALGASGLVELTVNGLGPRVGELPDLARRSGLHVMVGCGFYIHPSHPAWIQTASEDDLHEFFLRELAQGVGDTGILPALIGEIGTSSPITAREERVLRAATHAGAVTGAALNVHLNPRGSEALRAVEIAVEMGMPADRVILSHLDERIDAGYYRAIAQAGAILEFDTFGQEWYYSPDRFKNPSDLERCIEVERLLSDGYGAQLVLACDVCMKTCLKAYGGLGYDHLFRRIIPFLRERFGIGEDAIAQMFVETPRRLLDRPALSAAA